MFSNEELKQMMALAGVKNIPELQEQDHIDLEIMVEPDSQEPEDYGVPDDVAEPLAPKFEDEPMPDEGDTMVMQIPPQGGEMPMDIGAMGGEVPMDAPIDGGQVEIPMDAPCSGGQGEMPMDMGDMVSAFAQMPDDDFIAVIQGGIPDMEEKMQEFDNQDGEGSPVGSEKTGFEEDLIEIEEEEIEEDYDYANGYDDHDTINGEDYFPTGHDSNIRKKTGPVPKPADNNLTVGALPVDEVGDDITESLYKKYKSDYAKFLKESENK